MVADRFESYYDILTLGDSIIVNLAKGFSDRNVASRKISFGLRRTNLLKSTIHWNQDLRRTSQTPSIIGISNVAEFCAAIEAAIQRSRISKHSLEKSASLSKDANTGKLKRHNNCITWYRALKNYLSTIISRDRFPLSYVIRECAAIDYAIESQPDYSFE